MKKSRIIYLSRRLIAAAACTLAAVMMFWVVNHPAVVGASASTRQLPIYCVQKDYKVLSISFDAAWGDVILRRAPYRSCAPACSSPKYRSWAVRYSRLNAASCPECSMEI